MHGVMIPAAGGLPNYEKPSMRATVVASRCLLLLLDVGRFFLCKPVCRPAVILEHLCTVFCAGNMVWQLSAANQAEHKTGTYNEGQDKAIDGVPWGRPATGCSS